MGQEEEEEAMVQEEPKPAPAWRPGTAPLIFISHDTRDGKLAEAFAQLLSGCSGGMVKSFCSSDKKGIRGIPFGREWYTEIMAKLEQASDVVCLLTKRSVGRPWILYEAGVAKGRSASTPVHGVALGIPLSDIVSGPFAQFQNLEGNEDETIKLVMQLSRRHPDADPEEETVKREVTTFLEKVEKMLGEAGAESGEEEEYAAIEPSSVARSFEEIKSMFDEVRGQIGRALEDGPRIRSRRSKHLHPMMFEELWHMGPDEGPEGREVSWLLVVSLLRDDVPWLYELGMDIYRAMKSNHPRVLKKAVETFRRTAEVTLHGPMSRELFEFRDDRMMMMLHELVMMSEEFAHRLLRESTDEE